ncbi:MAG: Macrolide export ATP-binding/permease protein MacB [Firmicutes bacterium ADurb.Bin182]|nr:MAG: Macrolide export ATP-binding/permease protein MacB [Firmicutes bacterium ADurb.Bin182]
MILMNDISKTYIIGGEQVHALKNANLHIGRGEFVSIVGPSGSGKSTLMNIIGCLDAADSGEYILDGLPIGNYSQKQLAGIRSRKIGFVFQGFNLLAKMTAEENVELPLIYQGVKLSERKARVSRALSKVGLSDRSRHRPAELSGGQQQRVAIARALAADPAILLADEPTGNLDSKTGMEIMKLFLELHQNGNTIVLITHDSSIAKLAERRISILDGHVEDAV